MIYYYYFYVSITLSVKSFLSSLILRWCYLLLLKYKSAIVKNIWEKRFIIIIVMCLI